MEYSKVVLLVYNSFVYLSEDYGSFEISTFIEDLICDYPDIKFISYALCISYLEFSSVDECMEYLLSECDEVWVLNQFCDGSTHDDILEHAEDRKIPIIEYTDLA